MVFTLYQSTTKSSTPQGELSRYARGYYKNRLVEVKRKSYDIVTTEEVTSTGITCPETGTGSESGTGSTGTGSTGTGSTGTGSTGTGSTGTGSTSTGCTETTTTNTTTTTVTIPEYTLATYKYDTLGRRYEKKVYDYNQTTETTDLIKDISYIYSHQDAIQEVDAVASTTKEYIYTNEVDDLVASIQNSTTTYYEKNHLGSIVSVTDSSGSVLTEYKYDVYGKATIVSGTDVGNVRLYTGREFDSETGLYYNRARYYSASLGRFISRDPIGIKDNVNLYSYVGNNPLIYTDRMGLEKYLILIGQDKEGENILRIGAQYQYDQLIKSGIKAKNIIVKYDITTPESINTSIKETQGKIQKIILLAHGNEKSIGLHGEINKDNVKDLNTITDGKKLATELTIIACNTGGGDSSIAQDLSNELGVNVIAPSGYIGMDKVPSFTVQSLFLTDGQPTFGVISNTIKFFESFLGGEGIEWKQFN